MKNQRALISLIAIIGVAVLLTASCKKDTEQVEPKIPILATAEVTKICQLTAQSGGTISSDEGFEVTARGICWNATGNPTIQDSKTTDGLGAGIFTSKLTDLEIGTTYYVRAYATNSQGTAYGSTMIFETLGNTFTDSRDDNVYKMVTIGDQIWMAENLRYLPSITVPGTGSKTTPHYYVYGYDNTIVSNAKASANYTTYGVLYNWPAAVNACPTGWHLATDAEWAELIQNMGGTSIAGSKLKENGTAHWQSPNAGTTNETGFTALPGGYRGADGSFSSIAGYGYWWSATENNTGASWSHSMAYDSNNVYRSSDEKDYGFSVRCVRD